MFTNKCAQRHHQSDTLHTAHIQMISSFGESIFWIITFTTHFIRIKIKLTKQISIWNSAKWNELNAKSNALRCATADESTMMVSQRGHTHTLTCITEPVVIRAQIDGKIIYLFLVSTFSTAPSTFWNSIGCVYVAWSCAVCSVSRVEFKTDATTITTTSLSVFLLLLKWIDFYMGFLFNFNG